MKLWEGLNSEQLKAVTHKSGPALVVAGAGTGKTQVITRRVAWLIEQGLARPSEILALTFTEKAAAEMEERIDQLLPLGVLDTQVMTFHSFGDRLIKEFAMDIGLAFNGQVMTRTQQIVFLRDHIDELKLDYFAPYNRPDQYLDALAGYFSRLKDELITPERYERYATELQSTADDEATRLEAVKQVELARAYAAYLRIAREEGAVDFSDQIMLPVEIMQARPNVAKQVQARYKYILVDEFQDTNFAQSHLLRLITGSAANLMVVGDDDQSIYKFRGAAISNILGFRAHYSKAKLIVLTQNYRSTQNILDRAYRLIQQNNPDRLEAQEQINKYLTAAEGSGEEPGLLVGENRELEAKVVAEAARAELERDAESQVAILIRKRTQAAALLAALEQAAVNYHYSGSDNLYDLAEVKMMLNFIQYIVDPNDSQSLYFLLGSNVFNIDSTDLMTAASLSRRRNLPLERVLSEPDHFSDETAEKLRQFLQQVSQWRELASTYTVGQLAYNFLSESGYLKRIQRESSTRPELELVIRNLARFFGLLADYERVAADKSALGYSLAFQALRQAGEAAAPVTETNDARVHVMTVHQAKGLEFDAVIIYGLSKGTFPSNRRAETLKLPDELLENEVLPSGDWHIQEERRLMYVAMTRAKRRLLLSYSADHGGVRLKHPSPFIKEALDIEPPKPAAKPAPLEQIELFNPATPERQSAPRFIKNGKLYLTPHQIDDYLSCPADFRYKHVLEVPQPANPVMMYGSVIHQVINHYFTRRALGPVTLDELETVLAKLWLSDGFISAGMEQRRLQQARECIKRFFKREESERRDPKYSEYPFKVELPEHQVVVSGRFDAVYEDKAGVEIRDFKTSEVDDVTKADDKAASSIQLAIYALAWQRLTGQVPKKLVLDFVQTGKMGTATKSAAELDELAKQIGQVADGIRRGEYGLGKNHYYCLHD